MASNTVFDQEQAPLPNNQWTIEVSWWFAVSLGSIQHFIVDYASVPFVNPLLGGRIINDGTPATKFTCQNQKMLSNGDYQNFSVLGLCCVLIIGGITNLIALILPSLAGFVQKKVKLGNGKRILWAVDSDPQIQRMLYENSGYGEWQGYLHTVPTKMGTGLLDIPIDMEGGRAGLLENGSSGEADKRV